MMRKKNYDQNDQHREPQIGYVNDNHKDRLFIKLFGSPENKEYEGAKYCLGIAYELTNDEEVKKMLDTIPE